MRGVKESVPLPQTTLLVSFVENMGWRCGGHGLLFSLLRNNLTEPTVLLYPIVSRQPDEYNPLSQ